jgi:ribosomal protein S27E
MSKKLSIFSDSRHPQSPPCQKCGSTMQLARLEPTGHAGQYRRIYECTDCMAQTVVTDDSDAEIECLAERMANTRAPL